MPARAWPGIVHKSSTMETTAKSWGTARNLAVCVPER